MSLSTHVKKVLEGTGRKSLLSLIFSWEGLKLLTDGNIGEAKLIRGFTNGQLVGEDHLGNKYYENNSFAYGRKRWVVYKDTFSYNPTGIPAEWHGWINHINDYPPTKYQYNRPKYGVEAYVTKTGSGSSYAPKGAYMQAEKRTWKKIEPWQPPKLAAADAPKQTQQQA